MLIDEPTSGGSYRLAPGDKKKPLAGLIVEEEKKEEKVCCLDRL